MRYATGKNRIGYTVVDTYTKEVISVKRTYQEAEEYARGVNRQYDQETRELSRLGLMRSDL